MFAMEFESSTPSRASVLPKLSSTSPFAVMCRFTSTRPSSPPLRYPVAGFKGTLERNPLARLPVIHSLPSLRFPRSTKDPLFSRVTSPQWFCFIEITRISTTIFRRKFVRRVSRVYNTIVLSTDGNRRERDRRFTDLARWLDEKLVATHRAVNRR